MDYILKAGGSQGAGEEIAAVENSVENVDNLLETMPLRGEETRGFPPVFSGGFFMSRDIFGKASPGILWKTPS